MKLVKNTENDALTVAISGRIDTSTAPNLEEEIASSLEGVKLLNLDFTGVEYISSAGLRVLLTYQKKMTALGGEMRLTGVCSDVMEVFEMTGFSDILTIE